MCVRPLNHVICSLKSVAPSSLLLIFMSKQVFQTLFNSNLSHGV